ncbi:hypothetical protein BST81_03300 [Leptolyngbya sp. 'hensonii']|uniref:DUF2062 domain-containing protein n=1 Tax=Leptolyngbya sp. 'hensonii' TaxID=1922337 RepID=UPI00094FA136|nr:DUF2062 domain-containing protein [Leptolyngbya sp. 'hensonii']OLP19868.1 hypothetical protein BST81_03300 [Leptolyngbya sp. 'hensonii']
MKATGSQKSLFVKWKRFARYIYLRFLRLRGSPVEIARGFSIGIFWGMFPLPGLQMVVAIVTAAIFRGSKVAAAAGTWLTNPLTSLPIAALNFHVGQWFLGRELADLPMDNLQSPDGAIKLGGEFLTSFFLGCFITGTLMGMLSYYAGVPLIKAIKRRAAQRRIRRHH